MEKSIIGRRIKALREERMLTQDALAALFGFKDRQTISAIETGERRVTAEELLLAAQALEAPIEYFTDPFQLVGEERFSWRQNDVNRESLQAYERRAGSWIAAFRTLRSQAGNEPSLMRRALRLDRHSRFEDAMRAGESFARELELGATPATRLAEIMEKKLGILVLMVDATNGVSGAACRLPDLDAVLISRREVPGRRNFDLAHELFHLLTWDAMPPKHIEEAGEGSRNRVERLANNFASATLMPSEALERFGDWSNLGDEKLIHRLNLVANEMRVTSTALMWRLVALGNLRKSVTDSLSRSELRNNGGRPSGEKDLPPLFSRRFMETLGNAVDKGAISARRLSRLLDMPSGDIQGLFAAQGLESPVFP